MISEIIIFSHPESDYLSFENGKYTFDYNGKKIWYAGNPRYIVETFFDNQYKGFDCKGKTVVDIGAAEGDTLLWFSLNGARNVIAYEMDENRVNIAKFNRDINCLKDTSIYCEKVTKLPIPDDENWVVKIDVEGDEYNILENSKDYVGKYNQVILEYHKGLQHLPTFFKDRGFIVEARPMNDMVGFLLAKK